MQITKEIPTYLDHKYHGCGPYLVATNDIGEITDIEKIEWYTTPVCPNQANFTGVGSRSAYKEARSVYSIARIDAYKAWRAELQSKVEKMSGTVEVLDGSCFELNSKFTDLAWIAHDAIKGIDFWSLWSQ